MSTKPTKKNQESELLQEQIIKLEKQLESFKHSNDHFLKNKLFLHYDIKEPEKVVVECETKLPVLTEVDKKKIQKGKESDPVHLIIEGDNYHALSVLNYTHAGKVDVIYIDPPYNTGSNDFVYNDRIVDLDDNFRHSKWLSFIDNRLRIAKNLLKDDGIIFISIDDNEQAHLRLLCDKIFGEQNFVFQFVIDKTAQGANQSATFKQTHEYCLLYTNGKQDMIDSDTDLPVDEKKYKYRDDRGLYAITNSFDSINSPLSSNKNRGYTVYYNEKTGNAEVRDEYSRTKGVFGDFDKALIKKGYTPIRPGIRKGIQYPWNWISSRFMSDYKKDLVFMKNRKGEVGIYHKNRATGKVKDTTLKRFDTRNYGNQMLVDILGEKKFDYPKSLDMMKWVISKHKNKAALVLDFFAGSGTTGHAVLEKNKIDGGNRQFILCTNNENKIAEDVTYPRIKKVIDGYGDNAPIPANLRYFQTDFVEKKGSTSQLKIDLTRQCAEMLCVKENVFEAVKLKKSAKNYKFFKNGDKYLGVFFDFFTDPEFADFIAELNKLPQQAEKVLYIFVLDGSASILADEFASVANCEIKEIPQKILDIYKQLAREVARK